MMRFVNVTKWRAVVANIVDILLFKNIVSLLLFSTILNNIVKCQLVNPNASRF